MNWSNNEMRYAYIIGFMDCFRDGIVPFDEFQTFIDKANEVIDVIGYEMNYDEFENLISLYINIDNIDVDYVDGINYIIVGDIDDEDNLTGIVFMNNYLIETISLEDFKKLKFNEKSE